MSEDLLRHYFSSVKGLSEYSFVHMQHVIVYR